MHGEKQFIVIPTRVDGLDSCGMTSLCFLFPYKIPKQFEILWVPSFLTCNYLWTDITSISTGLDHNIAIGADGKVYTWGYNEHGQLGIGTDDDQEYIK